MVDPVTIKVIVDLFKDLLGILERGSKERRVERTFKPLYEKLEPIAKGYYGIVRKAALQLGEHNPDLVSILRDIQMGRAELIMTRESLLGEARAFIKDFGTNNERTKKAFERIRQKGELEKRALAFARAIVRYFRSAELGRPSDDPPTTNMSSLARLIEGAIRSGHSRNLQREAQSICDHLEKSWRAVGERYASLKLFARWGELRTTQHSLNMSGLAVMRQRKAGPGISVPIGTLNDKFRATGAGERIILAAGIAAMRHRHRPQRRGNLAQ